MRAPSVLSGPMFALYALWGAPSASRIAVVRFTALLAFSTLSLWAGLDKLAQPSWFVGGALAWILLSPGNLMNGEYWWIADRAFEAAPAVFAAVTVWMTWGMILWEIFFLHLILASRWTRVAALLWGVLFFLSAVFILRLRMLGWIELLLFTTLFFSTHWRFGSRSGALRLGRENAVGASSFVFGAALAAVVLLRMVSGGFAFVETPVVNLLRHTIGYTPMVLGIGPLTVYGEHELNMGSYVVRVVQEANQSVNRPIGDYLSTQEYYLNRRLAFAAVSAGSLCDHARYWNDLARAMMRDAGEPLLIRVAFVPRVPASTLVSGTYTKLNQVPKCVVEVDTRAGAAVVTKLPSGS
jgi:hypothetical protein